MGPNGAPETYSSLESSSSSSSSSDSDSNSDSDSKNSDEYEPDTDEIEQDTADGEALGIDLARFVKKDEFQFYKDKIGERIDKLIAMIDE